MDLPDIFNAAAWFVDRHVAEGRGGRVALECGDERVTYEELSGRVNRLGHALRHELDVRPDERVLLLMLDGCEMAYAFFAAIKIGAVPIPTNTLWRVADYEYVLNDSGAAVIVVSEALLPKVLEIPAGRRPSLRHIVVVGDGSAAAGTRALSELMAGGSAVLDAAPTSRDAPAFWLYSSGSTGSAKGCVHRHRDMVVCATLYAQGVLGMTSADRCFSVAKLFFAYGLGNALYFPLSVGATAILWPGPPAPADVYAVIERHRPTLFFSVPTNYGMLLAHHRDGHDFDLSSVRHAVSAGEALPPSIFERFKERFGVEILDGIGSTEALHIFISNAPGAIRPGSSGRVVPGYEARIVDDDNRPVAPGEIGNLLVKGDSICAYYWNRPDKTHDTFDRGWMRTGDKYREDADGFFWYAGRSDDMLKVGGIWVSPVEIESLLVAHPAVLECGVCCRDDRDGLTKPVAYVVLRPGVEGTSELAVELQQFVRSRTAEYKRPRWVEFLAELPKTATGKTQRFKLRERASSRRPD